MGSPRPGREETAASDDARAVDAEEAAEKAEMTSRTPQVAPRLNLPDRDGVWVLDYFPGQAGAGDAGAGQRQHEPADRPQRAARADQSGSRRAEVRLDRIGSKIHLHENQPVFYVSLTGGDDTAGPDAMSVATNDAKARRSRELAEEPVRDRGSGSAARLPRDHECDADQVGHQSENVTETTTAVLPGGHWMKVVPKQKLTVGQYALMEVLGPREINVSVWDFAIEPQSGDNRMRYCRLSG